MTDPLLLTALAGAGFLAGLVDSIAGGGGLISLPALLWAGLPPHLALGTNKLQSSFGSFTASLNYVRGGVVRLEEVWLGITITFIGAAVGTWSVQMIDARFLARIIPFLLTAVLIYTFASRRLGMKSGNPRWTNTQFYAVFGLLLGFYDGFFGPGTGSFWTLAMILLLGQDYLGATGRTKVMNFTSNFTALLAFAIGGNVVYPLGLVMGVGQMLGARVGSGMVLSRGVRFIRPAFLAMILLTTLKVWWDAFF